MKLSVLDVFKISEKYGQAPFYSSILNSKIIPYILREWQTADKHKWGDIVRYIANKLVYILVLSAIFYILFKIFKIFAQDMSFHSLAMTSLIQIIVLFVLAIISLVLTITIIKFSRKE